MSVIGLDIGHYSIKMVQMEKKGQDCRVLRYASEPVLKDGKPFDPERIQKPVLVSAIHDLCQKMKIRPKRVKRLVSSLSGSLITVKQIQTVEMGKEELESSLRFEARKHIPMDGTDANMDFQILGEDPRELDKINVLLVASTRRTASQHTEILKEAGFRPWVIDADPIALTNTYLKTGDIPDEGAIVLLNIGAVTSSLVVWGRKDQYFTREINIAGHQFTSAFLKNGVSYAQAEEVKKKEGVSHFHKDEPEGADSGFSIQVAEKSVFDHLVDELRRSLRFYIKKTNQSYFHKILITGGSAATPGLAAFISKQLNVPCEEFVPLKEFLQDKKHDGELMQYTIALGLALRGLEN